MKILHAYNLHRGRGGSDNACLTTIRLQKEAGFSVATFERDSRILSEGLRGRIRAFVDGIYAREGVRSFDAALRETRPDVVHVHELYPYISPWILPICRRARVPVVMTCYDFRLTCPIATHCRHGEICHRCQTHGTYMAFLNNCRSNRLESLSFALRSGTARVFDLFRRHVDRFIVLSEFSRVWMAEHAGIEPDRLDVIPCSVPLPSSPPVDPSTGGYVGYAGRFVREKGVETLIEAARIAEVPLVLAGDAAVHPALTEEDDARCILTRSPEELAEFYRGCRMLVVPSLWYETFGIVAAEAMSHGVPVVGSRLGALQDTIQDGLSGVLFPPGDAATLAKIIRDLWDDPARCRKLGAGARRQVAEMYSEKTHVSLLCTTYEAACTAQSTAG